MARSPYLTFDARRTTWSVLVALAIVPLGAMATKVLVETFTPLSYVIHWRETVPFIIVAVAFVINGAMNARGSAGRSAA